MMLSQTNTPQSNGSPFENFRAGFPVLREKVYLSITDKMILHDDVRASINVFLDHLAMASAVRTDHETRVTSSKERFAKLMNVAPQSVAAVRNVSDGVNSIAWALDWREGDNVVLSSDAEHPNNVYPWLRQRDRGVEVRVVPSTVEGAIDVEAMIEAMDARTRVVAAASVTFAPGHRTDIVRLGEAVRKRGALFLVDGVQSAGIFQHDLSALPVDAFATSTSKGLLGLYGYGFLYVEPEWMNRLSPAYLSRAAVLQKTDDHSTMGGFDWEYQDDGRRFEVGSFNLAGAYAADASLDLLLGLGASQIESHVLSLSTRLHEGLRAIGVTPAVPGSGPEQSHIVTIGELNAGGHGFSSDPLVQPLSERLVEEKVAHTIRRGQLRFGIHAYNNTDDIDATLAVVREAVKVVA